MIVMDIGQAVLFFVTLSLGLTLIAWIFFERQAVHPKFVREKSVVWTCVICAYTYVDSKHMEISQCPQCQSFNKRPKDERYVVTGSQKS